MSAYDRLLDCKALAKRPEPIDGTDCWHSLYQKAAAMESVLLQIVKVVDEYTVIIGKDPAAQFDVRVTELQDAMEARR